MRYALRASALLRRLAEGRRLSWTEDIYKKLAKHLVVVGYGLSGERRASGDSQGELHPFGSGGGLSHPYKSDPF